jgi:hypothetical protein
MTAVHWFERTLASRAEPHQRSDEAERAAECAWRPTFETSPSGKLDVASVKHCSILASPVVCSRFFESGPAVLKAKKGAEERDVCHG